MYNYIHRSAARFAVMVVKIVVGAHLGLFCVLLSTIHLSDELDTPGLALSPTDRNRSSRASRRLQVGKRIPAAFSVSRVLSCPAGARCHTVRPSENSVLVVTPDQNVLGCVTRFCSTEVLS